VAGLWRVRPGTCSKWGSRA